MRGLALALVVLAACGGPDDPSECTDGETRACYLGPPGTEGVGTCAPGLETCAGGRFTGICLGDIVPIVEHCDGLDEDCSGVVDDVAGSGALCTGDDGCEGVVGCEGSSVACVTPPRNACGVCDGPVVADVGAPCALGGCAGTLECTAAGDAKGFIEFKP